MSDTFVIKQGDTSPSFQDTLYMPDNVTPVNLSGATVIFNMATEDTLGSPKVSSAAVIANVAGQVRYDWVAGDTDTFGEYLGEWEVTRADGSIETYPNLGFRPIYIAPQAGAKSS